MQEPGAAELSTQPRWSTPRLHFSSFFFFFLKLENEHIACLALRRTHSKRVEVVSRKHLCQRMQGEEIKPGHPELPGKAWRLKTDLFFFNLLFLSFKKPVCHLQGDSPP